MESYEQQQLHHHQQQQEQQEIYDDFYTMQPPPAPHPQHPPPRSRSVPRYPHERPPHPQDPNYHDYGGQPPPLPPAHPHQQYYNDMNDMPPPLPHKTKKKSVLKSPLTAIKNAFMKSTRPLRRINSMSDPDRKPSKSALRRQNSMLERGMQRPYYPDEYPTYPAGFDERYYGGGRGRSVPPNAMRGREQYYDQVPQNYGTVPYPPHHYQQQQEIMNSTYQNLGEEDIYGHMGTVPGRERMSRERSYDPYGGNYPEQDDIYANRACIDLERRQMEAAQNRNGKRIMRRHSTTTADRANGRRPLMPANPQGNYEQDDIYQSKQGAYMLDNQRRAPNSEVMAEPSYVSKRDMGRPEPIYETKEESILQSRENETDEKKEGKTEINTQAEINHETGRLSPTELQKSCDTVIEATAAAAAPLAKNEEDDLEEAEATARDFDRSEMPTVIENKHNQGMLEQTTIEVNNETQDISDDVFETPQAVSSPLVVEGPPIEPLEPPKPTLPLTPRSSRAPFHISNILKRTGPPPLKKISDSRTSIETHYTSQASLPVGPPNATSTPYTSNMSLPIAGPVPTSAPAAASIPGKGSFPTQPREPTTCRGIFDSNGGTLADNVWNVSLEIPPGAIAPGVRQEIYFTVSDPRMGQAVGGPPLDMENGLFYFSLLHLSNNCLSPSFFSVFCVSLYIHIFYY